MLRRYQCILAAIAGLTLLAAADQPARNSSATEQAKKEQASENPTAEAVRLAYRPYPDWDAASCYQAKNHDTADLCAQWRAAVAAEKATREARRATTWTIVAALLSFATVVGLIVTIWQTHGALGEARRGNRIAMKANVRATRNAIAGAEDTARAIDIASKNAEAAAKLADQAESTAAHQLRAYLSVTSVVFYDHYAGRDDPQLVISIENHGQTPGTIVKKSLSCSWFVSGENAQEFFTHKTTTVVEVFPKLTMRIPFLMLPEISNGGDEGLIFLTGRIDYQDIFGRTHILGFTWQTMNRMTYSDIEHGESLAVRPFDDTPKKKPDS